MTDELKLAALYHLLEETLLNEQFSTRYSKMILKIKRDIFPLGQPYIRQIKTKHGLKLNLNFGDQYGAQLYFGVFTELFDFNLFNSLVSPGDIVVDVGSNFGIYTFVSALQTGNGGQVISFEPDLRSFELLKTNAEQNKFDSSIHLYPHCLGDYNGVVSFYEAVEPCFSSTLINGRNIIHEIRETPIKTLDTVCSEMNVPSVSLIKIDVEGAECKVLAGALGILEKSEAIIMLEVSKKNLNESFLQDLKNYLEILQTRFNYSAFQISKNGLKLVQYDNIADIFKINGGQFSGNIFLASDKGDRKKYIKQKFSKLVRTNKLGFNFLSSLFVEPLTIERSRALTWAERERGLLAMAELSLVKRNINTYLDSRKRLFMSDN